ncbi:hypothetical protein ACWF94_03765 [Streptomyces sp. NPDC055078]
MDTQDADRQTTAGGQPRHPAGRHREDQQETGEDREHTPGPESGPEQVPEPEPEQGPEPEPEQVPVVTPSRPRGRTALIVALAAVVGIVGGAAAGYHVQAGRQPTPLPALSQPDLGYPAKPLPESERPAPLPAAEDRQVGPDGDLRRLLVPKPARARDTSRESGLRDGWADVVTESLRFEDSAWAFRNLLSEDLRRIAGSSWEQGDRETEIRLLQFRRNQAAVAMTAGRQIYLRGAGGTGGEVIDDGHRLRGSGNGRFDTYKVPAQAGNQSYYEAHAIFQRGDIVADIFITDSRPIGPLDIRALAERQLERL